MTASFEIVSSKGAVIRTFDCRTAAVKWAGENRETFPGLRIERVERTETRLRVWSDRSHLRLIERVA